MKLNNHLLSNVSANKKLVSYSESSTSGNNNWNIPEILKQNIENLSDNNDSLSRENHSKNTNGKFDEESTEVERVDEIPGTPQPIRNEKRKSNNNDSAVNVTQIKRQKNGEDMKTVTETSFFNFPLSNFPINKIKDNVRKDRSISMLSSPSMMSSSSKAAKSVLDKSFPRSDAIASTSSVGSFNEGNKYRSKQFDGFKIDEVFDSSPPPPKKKIKVDDKSGTSSSTVDSANSGNKENKTDNFDIKLSPVKAYVPNPDLSQINLKLVSQIKERSKNLRLILEDLVKTR